MIKTNRRCHICHKYFYSSFYSTRKMTTFYCPEHCCYLEIINNSCKYYAFLHKIDENNGYKIYGHMNHSLYITGHTFISPYEIINNIPHYKAHFTFPKCLPLNYIKPLKSQFLKIFNQIEKYIIFS